MKRYPVCLSTLILMLGGLVQPTLKAENLIPATPGTAPDYFCTWNVQGYVLSYAKDKLDDAMMESNISGSRKYQNRLGFHFRIRSDFYFIVDDSRNVVLSNYDFGADSLNPERFPVSLSSVKADWKNTDEQSPEINIQNKIKITLSS